jgi:ATP-binding cassette subfamily B protein
MRSLWRIVTFTRELWPFYIAVSVFSVLVAAASQVQPLLVKGIIDQATNLGSDKAVDMKIVALYIGGMFVADVLQTIFSNVGGYVGDVLQARLSKVLSEKYFSHIMSLPQRYYDTELSGKALNRLNRSIGQITSFVQTMSNNFLQFIFSTVLSLIIVFVYSWQVGLMLAALYPIFVWLTTRTSAKWRAYQEKINLQLDSATGRFAEVLGQIKVVKSFNRQDDELKLFSKRYGKVVDITRPQSKLWHGQDVVRRLVLNVIFLGVFAFIFVNLAQGSYTVGTAVLLLQYALNIRMPIFSISFIIDQSQRAIANSRDYFAVMDEASEADTVGRRETVHVASGAIEFKDVSFGYDDGQTVIDRLSMDFEPGTKTALVGESGEGKTTITSLLLGLYQPRSGQILFDGQDIHTVKQASLRSQVAVVFQEPALFSGTIKENIAYGDKTASLEQIKKAAHTANADEFIAKFEKGYDTMIGERGLKLSGGQKQRIAIARALLKDAPVLILDEATSSLDTRSERLVQEALEHLMHGRTTIIIAHRLSTIQSVDKIITIKNGRLDEEGSPAELAVSGGIYDQLLKLQQQKTTAGTKKLRTYELR